jgi:Lipid A 3-O-deacylase (PagL)
MHRAFPLALLIAVITARSAIAQQPSSPPEPLEPLLAVGSSEMMITGGPAFGEVVFHSSPDHKYMLTSLSWGRIMSRPVGPGVLRGRFQWAVEVVPLFAQYAPGDTFGVGVTPLAWRWNFDPRGRLAPFAELAGGLLFTLDPVPAALAKANFTAHISYGVRYFFRPTQALVFGYEFHHISNGNRLEKNPGVNAHVLQAGVSLMRAR